VFRSAIFSIRTKVDEVYRKLQQLCDVLEGVTQAPYDPNPHELRISESNELLDGMKKLFVESDTNEQIRLMTISPREWGRQKIERWFVFIVIFSIFFHLLNYLSLSISYIY
jgi:hypothetical protein